MSAPNRTNDPQNRPSESRWNCPTGTWHWAPAFCGKTVFFLIGFSFKIGRGTRGLVNDSKKKGARGGNEPQCHSDRLEARQKPIFQRASNSKKLHPPAATFHHANLASAPPFSKREWRESHGNTQEATQGRESRGVSSSAPALLPVEHPQARARNQESSPGVDQRATERNTQQGGECEFPARGAIQEGRRKGRA
jgi:hypothetical protein